MAADPDVKKAAKEFIDGALAARARDSAIRRRSRRSRMDEPSTRQPDVFERLQGTTVQRSRDHAGALARCSQSGDSELGRRGRRLRSR